jgi:CheY-like chemotaxis protein
MPEKVAGRKILVVDDEKSAREGLAELMASWGHQTESPRSS